MVQYIQCVTALVLYNKAQILQAGLYVNKTGTVDKGKDFHFVYEASSPLRTSLNFFTSFSYITSVTLSQCLFSHLCFVRDVIK